MNTIVQMFWKKHVGNEHDLVWNKPTMQEKKPNDRSWYKKLFFFLNHLELSYGGHSFTEGYAASVVHWKTKTSDRKAHFCHNQF